MSLAERFTKTLPPHKSAAIATLPKSRPEKDAKARPRFALLDGLRLFAAFMVVAYHYLAFKSDVWGADPATVFPNASQIAKYGALGVELFFIISGFVILMTAWGRTREQYVASRISRLFPSYWVCVIATSLLLLVIWPGQKKVSWTDALVNLTMTQHAFGVPHIDGVYWTLWAELRFYVLVLLFMCIGLTYKRLLAFAVIWPVLGSMAHMAGSDLISAVLVWKFAPFFAGGIAIFLLYKFGSNLIAWLVLGLDVALAIPNGDVFFSIMADNTGLPVSGAVGSIVIVLSFGAVALVTLTRLRAIQWKFLTTAGLLTYPLYLLHEWWGWYIIDNLHAKMDYRLVLLCAVGAAVLGAWLVVRFVERPLSKRMRDLLLKALTVRQRRRSGEGDAGAPGSAPPDAGKPAEADPRTPTEPDAAAPGTVELVNAERAVPGVDNPTDSHVRAGHQRSAPTGTRPHPASRLPQRHAAGVGD